MVRGRRSLTLSGIALASALALAGCLGPEDGDDAKRVGIGAEKAKLPGANFVPPAAVLPPVPSVTPAVADAAHAEAIARAALYSAWIPNEIELLRPSSPGRAHKYNGELYAGPQGGTVLLTGKFNKKGIGWYETTFAGYGQEGRVLDGRVTYRISTYDKKTGKGAGTTQVHGLRLRVAGEDVTLDGTLNWSIGFDPSSLAGTLAIRRADGYHVRVSGFTIRVPLGCNGIDCPVFSNTEARLGFAGTVSESTAGVFAMTQSGKLEHAIHTPRRLAAGRLDITQTSGAGSMFVRVHTPEWFGIYLDDEADGEPDRFTTRVASAVFDGVAPAQSGPLPPVAVGVPTTDEFLAVGGAYALDAITSFDPNGDFMTARWIVERAPQGEVFEIADPGKPYTGIRAIAAGGALLVLELDDGSAVSRDTFRLQADHGTPHPTLRSLMPPGQIALGDDRRIEVGEELILDARHARLGSVWTNDPTWSIWPAASGATLTDLGDGRARFVATVPGEYRVFVERASFMGRADEMMVRVGPGVRHFPALRFSLDVFDQFHTLTLGDPDGDGDQDVLAPLAFWPQEGSAGLRYFEQVAPARFAGPVALHGGSPYDRPVFFDIDGAGGSDIFTHSNHYLHGGLQAVLNDAPAGFGTTATLPDPSPGCSSSSGPRPKQQLVDMDGDGVRDLFLAMYRCAQSVIWRAPGAGLGVRFTRAALPMTDLEWGSVYQVLAGDFDGDGLTDVAALRRRSGVFHPVLTLYRRGADGSFVEDVELALGSHQSYGEVIDLDEDGRDELYVPSMAIDRTVSVIRLAGGAWSRTDLTAAANIAGLFRADVDGDGADELVVTGERGFAVIDHAAAATTIGPFRAVHEQLIAANADMPSLAFSDLDGDGLVDLLFPDGRLYFARPD